MDQQQRFESEPGTPLVPEASPSRPSRKAYTSPEIQDWGSITDLTRGLKLGLEDFPIEGGSRVA